MCTSRSVNSQFHIQSAIELWKKESSLPAIPTFSQALDKILGSEGIELGTITELLGLSGTGKTQLCLQLCASVQIPKCLGGLEAEAMFIDTNTNFTIHRYKEILLASYKKCQALIKNPKEKTMEELLNKLHYIDGFGLEKFCAVLHKVPEYISSHPNIKLIAIDSILYPYKEGIDEKQRTRLLFQQMSYLQGVAVDKQIAIVVTNEMSTRVGLCGDEVVGAAGDSWAHRHNTTLALTLGNRHKHRNAQILKSNTSTQKNAPFQITEEGIRDV